MIFSNNFVPNFKELIFKKKFSYAYLTVTTLSSLISIASENHGWQISHPIPLKYLINSFK